MNYEEREKRIKEIMGEICNRLSEKKSLSLEEMSKPYRKSEEIGLCLMAFSRLEAEGIIAQKLDDTWTISERKIKN